MQDAKRRNTVPGASGLVTSAGRRAGGRAFRTHCMCRLGVRGWADVSRPPKEVPEGLGGVEEGGEPFGCIPLHVLGDVTVDVGRDHDARMAEAFTDDLQGRTSLHGQGRGKMA